MVGPSVRTHNKLREDAHSENVSTAPGFHDSRARGVYCGGHRHGTDAQHQKEPHWVGTKQRKTSLPSFEGSSLRIIGVRAALSVDDSHGVSLQARSHEVLSRTARGGAA